ncbi:hypothetical protein UNDYM_5924 (plasmid) [Undibacterium sp. YM2]|nr:hypothetical protein UNDYM_5924 [Undibacterium sp. YM2]
MRWITALHLNSWADTLRERPVFLPMVTVNGFLVSGQLKLSGRAPMTASMSFVEPKEKDNHLSAFCLCSQTEKLSVPTAYSIRGHYLPEVDFGFRYTLEGLARLEQVTTLSELIRVLDDISPSQRDLANFTPWQPEIKGS